MPGRGRVEVTGGFWLLMAWLNYTDTQGLLPMALAAAALHEAGHWLAIRALGGRITRLRLSAVGAEMRLYAPMSYGRELLCALSGPAVNMVLAFAAAGRGTEKGYLFAGLNLSLGLFNLLPIGRLDGGRALDCALAWLLGPQAAGRVCAALDRVCVSLLVAGGILLTGAGGSFLPALIGLWLWMGVLQKLGGKRGCQGPFKRVK